MNNEKLQTQPTSCADEIIIDNSETPTEPEPDDGSLSNKYSCINSACKIDNTNGEYGTQEDCEKKCNQTPDMNSHTLKQYNPVVNVSYYTNNYPSGNNNNTSNTTDHPTAGNIRLSNMQNNRLMYRNNRRQVRRHINNINRESINNILSKKSEYCPVIIGNARGYGEFASREN